MARGIVTLLILLVSCSPIKQFNKLTSKHPELIKERTVIKDSLIKGKDSVIVKIDTINNELVKTVNIYRVDTITTIKHSYIPDKSCELYVKTLRQLNRESRLENKRLADSLDYELKKQKQATKEKVKVTRIENRSNWWLWLLIGVILTLGIQYVIKTVIKSKR